MIHPFSGWRRTRRRALAAVTVLGCCAMLPAAQFPAGAINVPGTPSPVTGNATWFSGLGSPYGGCGLPQADLDSQDFLALNVQNSPGVYSDLPRPIPAADASEIGMFDNGLNCGRWVQVTIGDYCTGINDGAPDEPFCRSGSWVSDQYNGATLDFVVGDSCDDGNAWCKDDPYHVDLAQASLNNFVRSGQPVANMYPDHWNNRQVSWQFIPAPGYTGDIRIGAIQGAQPYWPAIAISHLPNGITGVQYQANGSWVPAQMDSDMGDDYIIGPTTGAGTAGTQYEIRVIDSSGNLVGNGEVYSFTLPAGCTDGCPAAYTPVSYTTSTGVTSSPSPSPSPSSPSPTGSTQPATGCALTAAITNSWPGGYQMQLTVTNNGGGNQSLSALTCSLG
ncbi:MAG: hypothetical protein ACRDND_10140 [Streptosporangiaceae bacterium]